MTAQAAPAEPAEKPKPTPRPKLSIVKREEEQPTANVLLYGPPKVGKSTAAASAPPRVLYLNADLPNAMQHPYKKHGGKFDEVRVEGLQTLMDVTNAIKAGLEAGNCEWNTLACDPMHDLYRLLVEDLSKRATRPTLPTIGDAQTHVERFARQMCELPINTVWVAHETTTKDESNGNIERIPFMGTTNDRPAGKLMGMVDVIGYCQVLEDEASEIQHLAQIKAANGRRAGDRFDILGKVRSLDLGEWFTLIAEASQDTSNNEAPQQVQKGAKA